MSLPTEIASPKTVVSPRTDKILEHYRTISQNEIQTKFLLFILIWLDFLRFK